MINANRVIEMLVKQWADQHDMEVKNLRIGGKNVFGTCNSSDAIDG